MSSNAVVNRDPGRAQGTAAITTPCSGHATRDVVACKYTWVVPRSRPRQRRVLSDTPHEDVASLPVTMRVIHSLGPGEKPFQGSACRNGRRPTYCEDWVSTLNLQ